MVESYENIDVLVAFRRGRFFPLRFLLRGREYPIRRVCGAWKKREGVFVRYIFSVEVASGDVYEIALDTRRMAWRIERVLSPSLS